MRTLLITALLFLAYSADLSAQSEFDLLNEKTYNYYLNGDYKNLKITSDTIFSKGMDFYYLRMRIGILSYNKQYYSDAVKHFRKALEFNATDTLSMEYVYFSYLFSGRKADAYLYLKSIPWNKRSKALKSINTSGLSDVFIGSTGYTNSVTLYETNNLYYEAVKNSLSFSAGFETYFSENFKGTFAYTNYNKTGTVYSENDSLGTGLDFMQNQFYTRLTGSFFPGWELTGFGHVSFYPDVTTQSQTGNSRYLMSQTNIDYLLGAGISKNGWKVRTGANFSVSNFGGSNQVRGEGYLTYLPFANLNFYLTSGGMYQHDRNWGETYQVNQELGFKVFDPLWIEAGIVKGNSFLYARNYGYLMNNSFQTPATTIYGNFIILPGKHFRITATPFYSENQIYSWDLDAYSRTDKLSVKSFGGVIKLSFKIK